MHVVQRAIYSAMTNPEQSNLRGINSSAALSQRRQMPKRHWGDSGRKSATGFGAGKLHFRERKDEDSRQHVRCRKWLLPAQLLPSNTENPNCLKQTILNYKDCWTILKSLPGDESKKTFEMELLVIVIMCPWLLIKNHGLHLMKECHRYGHRHRYTHTHTQLNLLKIVLQIRSKS